MNSKIDIFQQELSRKQFLQYMGVAVLGIIGVTGFMQRLRTSFGPANKTKADTGYGKSAYGR